MQTATYGRVGVVLPYLEDDHHTVAELPESGILSDYLYANHQIRELAVTEGQLSNGRISKIDAQRVTMDTVRLESAYIEGCTLTSLELADCTLSRVIFRECKILGARFNDSKWANVVFDRCRLEYSDLDAINATGAVVFANTILKEVTFTDCELPNAVMKDCTLTDVAFEGGQYKGLDLRGTDLDTIRGAANLSGALIDITQRIQLAEALVAELDLNYPEDLE